jgi:hypothetical protein
MPRDNDSTRPAPDIVEAGIPATTEMPPGVPAGWEAEEEPAPLDVPQGVETWGTTADEEQAGEPLALRVLREQPDAEQAPTDSGVRLLEPGASDGLFDDEPDAVGEVDATTDDTLAPEESAMRLEDEPAGLTYDRTPGYLDAEE